MVKNDSPTTNRGSCREETHEFFDCGGDVRKLIEQK